MGKGTGDPQPLVRIARGPSWKQGDQLEVQEEIVVARTGEEVERAENERFVLEANLTGLVDGLD